MTISNGFIFRDHGNDVATPNVQDAHGKLHNLYELEVLTKGPIIIGIVDPDWGGWGHFDDFSF